MAADARADDMPAAEADRAQSSVDREWSARDCDAAAAQRPAARDGQLVSSGSAGHRPLMSSWEELEAAEEELRQRERAALAAELGPEEMRALAAERDKLAADRDALSGADDETARSRDRQGLQRDVRGSRRDRVAREYAQDLDWAAVDRYIAGTDRDFAAGDRADSGDDRRRAAESRQRAADDRDAAATQAAAAAEEATGLREALTTRLLIGQAEGLLMAEHHLDEDAAFALLVKLPQQAHLKLRVVAERIVRDHASAIVRSERDA